MLRVVLAILLALLLSACAPGPWMHASKDQMAYEHDVTYCRAEAAYAAVGAPVMANLSNFDGSPIPTGGLIKASRLQRCMTARGWTR